MNSRMLPRFAKLGAVAGLIAALWALSSVRRSDRAWVHPGGKPAGPVKILEFYASVGSLTRGEKAMLCYGVENAKSVRIAPISQDVYPSFKRCLEIVPEHTTHYTILAEGFDGKVAIRSFILSVHAVPVPPRILSDAGSLERIVMTGNAPVTAERPGGSTAAEADRT
jgi:hypothetical protein